MEDSSSSTVSKQHHNHHHHHWRDNHNDEEVHILPGHHLGMYQLSTMSPCWSLYRGCRALLVSVGVLMLMVLPCAVGLSDVAYSYRSDGSDLNHFAYWSQHDVTFLAAGSNLYKLWGNLSVHTSTTIDSTSDPDADVDHVNKLLLVDHGNGRIVLCGTMNEGKCQTRYTSDIGLMVIESDLPLTNGQADLPTIGVLLPGASPVLYLGNTINALFDETISSYSVPLIVGQQFQYEHSPPNLDSLKTSWRIIRGPTEQNNDIDITQIFYIYGFSYERYTFFVQVQSDYDEAPDYPRRTMISRLCHNDQFFITYVEIPLHCSGGGTTYHNAVAATLEVINGEKNVIVSFTENPDSDRSAICVYSMDDIQDKFEDNLDRCYRGSNRYASITPRFSNAAGCATNFGTLNDFCSGISEHEYNSYAPLTGKRALSSDAIVTDSTRRYTALTAQQLNEDQTVLFVGTSDGKLKKILYLGLNEDPTEYDEIDEFNSLPIMSDIVIDGNGHVIVMTSQMIYKIYTSRCVENTDCASCVGAEDPYCGWCSLEGRCTTVDLCGEDRFSDRWIGFNDRCYEVDRVDPEQIPLPTIQDEITIHVTGMASLSGDESYLCEYRLLDDDAERTLDTTTARIRSSRNLRCPMITNTDDIVLNEARASVSLYIVAEATGVDIFQSSLMFYKCDEYEDCGSCSETSLYCKWCLYDNTCRYTDAHCNQDGATFTEALCPMLTSAFEEEIPSTVSSQINIEGENFPDPNDGDVYHCELYNEETLLYRVPAVWVNSRNIECESHVFTINTGSVNASVKLKWQDKRHEIQDNYHKTVTLYNCGGLADDCSLCSSTGFDCLWCNGQCQYNSGECSSADCASPIITEVEPVTGLHSGGTLITIRGSDLGTVQSSVSVTVGGSTCDVREYSVAKYIVCEVPDSRAVSDDRAQTNVIVFITGKGQSQPWTEFHYQHPVLHSMWVHRGPVSGGTLIQFNGTNLDTGNDITVVLRGSSDVDCVFVSVSSTILSCTTPRVTSAEEGDMEVTVHYQGQLFDLQDGNNLFTYSGDPNITKVSPTKSYQSGGRTITVEGVNFTSIQKPQMIIWTNNNSSHPQDCRHVGQTGTLMECDTPKLMLAKRKRRETVDRNLGFIMDNVISLRRLDDFLFEVVLDPMYEIFPDGNKVFKGDNLVLEGENLDLACTKNEVIVKIGAEFCEVQSLSSNNLVCTPPEDQPPHLDVTGSEDYTKLPTVIVQVGSVLQWELGKLEYQKGGEAYFPIGAMIGIVAGGSFLIVIIIVIIIIYQRKSSNAERQYKKMQGQLDMLESNVRNECKQAFAELQTEVSDLTRDLNVMGIPFWDYKTYTFKVLFPCQRDHPVMQPNTLNKNDYKIGGLGQGLMKFNQLLNNRQFLLIFIRTLEAQQNFSIRDKAQVASLLMIILFDKMDYATEILKALLNELIDKSVEKNPKLMLRRTESVVEKFLTNWLSICMYGYIKQHAGSSMFMLFKAIKQQTEKGPVDALTSEARYSLSEDRLLREKIDPRTLSIHLQVDSQDEYTTCRVLDCDTITQAKEKCLDSIYKNTPFSKRPTVHDISLEWKSGKFGRLPLQDSDVTTEVKNGWKRVNTLAHYNVAEGAVISVLTKKPAYDTNVMREVNGRLEFGNLGSFTTPVVAVEDGTKVWHLVKHDDNQQANRTQKAISEIFLTRLLSTKGTVQSFIDDLFLTILRVDNGLPMAVKFLFDLLDGACRRHNIVDPEVVHVWKCNSLPLRFWVNMLKNPEFVFDVQKSHIQDSCLSVIAQTFMDACSQSEHRLGKDSPSNKLLFARDIPRYRKMVEKFFKDVQMMPQVSDAQMAASMTDLSMKNTLNFNVNSALQDLYKYAQDYNYELYEALEVDVSAQKQQLAKAFEHVSAVINGTPLY